MNIELLEKIQLIKKSTCFVLDMGKGKTETLKYYIQNNTQKKLLIILNNIDQLKNFKEEIGTSHITIWYSHLSMGKFSDIRFTTTLAITKAKFFQLLIHKEFEFLNQFDEYIYDEFSGLSPLTVSELIDDIITVIQKLQYSTHVNFILRLSTFFQNILSCMNDPQYKNNTVYLLPVSDKLQQQAIQLLSEYWSFRDTTTTQQILYLDQSILIILQAICDLSVFISKFINVKEQQKYAIAVKNDQIKDFIKDKKFIILDATGKFNEAVYQYLEITLDYNFSDNPVNYNNLIINLYHIAETKQRDSRQGDIKALDRISQLLYSNKKHEYYTFAPKNSIDPLIKKFGLRQEKLYYFFSGYDIGSNNFKDESELNIISLQTYPKIFRTVYNHIFHNIPLDEANRIENDLSEWYLLSRNLTQLIGRLRIAEKKEAIVNLYCIHEKFAYLAKELHFKDCHIIIHNKSQKNRTPHQQVIDLISIRLSQTENRDYVYITDIIENCIHSKSAQTEFIRKYKQN